MVLRIQDIGVPKGAHKRKKRVGRGIGSGHGKTSGRGHKGSKSRSGRGLPPGFEGGQMTLIRRLPKRGFTNIHKREWNVVNVDTFQKLVSVKDGATVDKDFLVTHGIIKKARLPLKVLAKGSLSKKITVKAEAFSESAKKAIESAGGKIELVTRSAAK